MHPFAETAAAYVGVVIACRAGASSVQYKEAQRALTEACTRFNQRPVRSGAKHDGLVQLCPLLSALGKECHTLEAMVEGRAPAQSSPLKVHYRYLKALLLGVQLAKGLDALDPEDARVVWEQLNGEAQCLHKLGTNFDIMDEDGAQKLEVWFKSQKGAKFGSFGRLVSSPMAGSRCTVGPTSAGGSAGLRFDDLALPLLDGDGGGIRGSHWLPGDG